MNKQRSARLNIIMSKVSANDDCLNDNRNNDQKCIENEDQKENVNSCNKYHLRELAKKRYCEETDKDKEGDFSPDDESEYIPSPDRGNDVKTPSSYGGDSIFIETAVHNISKTPSTISNISYILNQSDFTADLTVIYDNRTYLSEIDTPKTYKIKFTSSPCENKKMQNKNHSVIRRCLNNTFVNYSSTDKEDPMPCCSRFPTDETMICNIVSNPSNLAAIEKVDEQEEPKSCTELLTNDNSHICDPMNSEETLTTGNHSDSILIDDTIVMQDQTVNFDAPIENVRPDGYNSDIELQPETIDTKKITRKRSRNENDRIANKSKRLKNSGKSYVGCKSKREFPEKKLKAECQCKKKCGSFFTQGQRENIMLTYYKLGDHERQWQYILNHVESEHVKRITVERKCNRTQTCKYFFRLNEEKVYVCRTFFINTLSICNQTIYTALEKKKRDDGLIDNRGRHENRPRKMPVETEENIMQHIQLFPSVESHYVRKDSHRQFLSELLNISLMYRLYKTWFQEGNFSCKIGSKRQYETIFNTKFNYSFFRPKKDQCSKCTLYRGSSVSVQETMQDKYNQHITNKNRVREIKTNEKASVDRSKTTIAIFDLEKVLSIPRSEVGVFHYKRKYAVYNFTVYNSTQKKGYCYLWHAQIAKRGAIEIASCLLKFLQNEKENGIENVSFYSDGCAGQNKNRFIFAFYAYAAQKLKLNISHRFFETGHGQSEGDSMHSNIERQLKHRIVYTPEQIYSVVTNAKIHGEKYFTKEMTQNDFYDIKVLVNNKNWAKDEGRNKIMWSKVMEVSVSHTHPSILKFKYNFDSDYQILNTEPVQRRKRGTRQTGYSDCEPQLQVAYTEPLLISKELYRDLKSLCTSGDIPTYYHSFYESLSCESGTEYNNRVNTEDVENEASETEELSD